MKMIPFFVSNETGNLSKKWENKVAKGEANHSIAIELYLNIHNARSGVNYV
jgi:hypothetical protein